MNEICNPVQVKESHQQLSASLREVPDYRREGCAYISPENLINRLRGRMEKEYGMTKEEAEECFRALG